MCKKARLVLAVVTLVLAFINPAFIALFFVGEALCGLFCCKGNSPLKSACEKSRLEGEGCCGKWLEGCTGAWTRTLEAKNSELNAWPTTYTYTKTDEPKESWSYGVKKVSIENK